MRGRHGQHGEKLIARTIERVRCIHPHRVEPLAPAIRARALLQQGQVGQHLGNYGLVGAAPAPGRGGFEQAGGANGHHVFVHQQLRLHAGPIGHLLRCARVQGGIKGGVGKQKRPRLRVDVHHDVRMQLRQLGQTRDEPAGGKGGHCGQRERAALALVGHHIQRVALQPL
ncbi:hypothetical protein D3C72_1753820 [compost metagenome]